VVIGAAPSTHGPTTIYRVKIAGSTGKVVGSVELQDSLPVAHGKGPAEQFWIAQGKVVLTKPPSKIGIWAYPAGGKPQRTIATHLEPWGLTLSFGTQR
jgi:hypothetical protein